jgi:hypothetical protein
LFQPETNPKPARLSAAPPKKRQHIMECSDLSPLLTARPVAPPATRRPPRAMRRAPGSAKFPLGVWSLAADWSIINKIISTLLKYFSCYFQQHLKPPACFSAIIQKRKEY